MDILLIVKKGGSEGMKKLLSTVLSLCLTSVLLIGCSSSESAQTPVTKTVTIFDTDYTIQENWLVETQGPETFIYFQSEKPELVYDGIIIQRFNNVLQNAQHYSQAENYIILMKESLIKTGLIGKEYTETRCDRDDTPVLRLSGEYKGMEHSVYLFMSSYTDAVMLQYFHNPKKSNTDYSDNVKEMVESMVTHFDGFKTTSAPTYVDPLKPTGTCKHPGCNNIVYGTEYCSDHQGTVTEASGCDGEPYGAGSDWAKYDKNGDGCINDAEFQAGMGDAAENRLNGSTSGSSTSNRNGLCEFMENGRYVCNKKAMSGMSYCQEHWDLLKSTYDNLTGH